MGRGRVVLGPSQPRDAFAAEEGRGDIRSDLGNVENYEYTSSPEERDSELESKLRDLGRTVTLSVHPGTQHAFFNDTRPEVYDAAASAVAWSDTLALFRRTL